MRTTKERKPQQSRVIQNQKKDNKQNLRLRQFIQCRRHDIQIGGPFEYIIDAAELWNGTRTNQNTRNHVNNGVVPPNHMTLDYKIYIHGMMLC